MQTLARVIAFFLVVLVGTTSPRLTHAHDVYRFVGTVVRWNPAKRTLDIRVKETQDDGKVTESIVHMGVPDDVIVTRILKKVPRSELKPGIFVVVDAAGVDMIEIDATEIEIVVPPRPATAAPASGRK